MAKAKGKVRKKPIFYLAAALVCERVLVEGDKVPSYMRVVDQVTLPRPVQEIPPGGVVAFNLTLVITFRNTGSRGKFPFRIERVGPSKARVLLIETEMEFSSDNEEGGSTVGVQLHMKWDGEGVYWFDVFLNRKFQTSIPLRVSLAKPMAPESPGGKPKKV